MSDEKAIKAITILMQNVVNKLDDISKNIDSQKKDNSIEKSLQKIYEISESENGNILSEISVLKESLKESNDLNKLETQLTEMRQGINNFEIDFQKVIESKPENIVTNNKTIIVFGDDATFSVKTLLFFLTVIVICWSSIKYLPSYFSERSNLKVQKDLYYDYYKFNYYLKFQQEDQKGIEYMERVLEMIQTNDSSFVKKYEELQRSYSNEIKKRELESQLKELDK